MQKLVIDKDGNQSIVDVPANEQASMSPPLTPEEIAAAAKRAAADRIAQIRAEMADKLADIAVGTPAEQGTAKAALGLLRAELAIEKAKL